uniref:Uncharacterized protein n=1 Tax=viral metagenome TaxID=1070528 RepID=A0A6C0CC79_9ZZZZ
MSIFYCPEWLARKLPRNLNAPIFDHSMLPPRDLNGQILIIIGKRIIVICYEKKLIHKNIIY